MNERETDIRQGGFEGDFDLGAFLGQQQAFGLIAGRCSAAQAVCLREIYEKLYKKRCPDWERFCRDYLHMSRNTVQQIIRLLNEFGTEYFEFSQLMRINAETYRAIRPAIQDKSLHVDGESIALIPANAARISAAVASLRKPAARPNAPKASRPDRFAALEERCSEVLKEFEALARAPSRRQNLVALRGFLKWRLEQLKLQP